MLLRSLALLLVLLCAVPIVTPAASAQTTIDLNQAKFYWDWSPGAGSGAVTTTALVADPAARSYPVKNVVGAAGQYYCVVTAANAYGETAPTNEVFFDAGVIPSSPSTLRVAP